MKDHKWGTICASETILPLCVVDANGKPLELLGTCFRISSYGLYLTAAHLFPYWCNSINEYKRPEMLLKRMGFEKENYRLCLLKKGKWNKEREKFSNICVPIDFIYFYPDSDIALLLIPNEAIVTQKEKTKRKCQEKIQVSDRDNELTLMNELPPMRLMIKHFGHRARSTNSSTTTSTSSLRSFELAVTEGKISQIRLGVKNKGFDSFTRCVSTAKTDHGQIGGPVMVAGELPIVLGVNSISDGITASTLFSPIEKIINLPITAIDSDAELFIYRSLLKKNDELPISLSRLAEENIVKIISSKSTNDKD